MKEDDMIPDKIILDTYQSMKDLRDMAAELGETPEFPDDLAQRVVEWIADGRNAPRKIHELTNMVRDGEFDEGDDDPDDIPPVYADAVFELGNLIYSQLRAIGAYMPDGRLAYQFFPPYSPKFGYPNDLILLRQRELPKYDE